MNFPKFSFILRNEQQAVNSEQSLKYYLLSSLYAEFPAQFAPVREKVVT